MKNAARFSDNDKRRLFRNAADKMGLNDAIVEKDFWVCFTLDYLFQRSPCNRYIVEHADRVIAVYDGREKDGTVKAIRYAHQFRKELREIPLGLILDKNKTNLGQNRI